MAPQQGDSIETLYVDIAARADELIKDADAAVRAVVKRLDEIDKKTEETERSFSSLGSFIKDALSTAAGIGLAKVGASLTGMIADFGRAMIDSNAQMQMYERSFTTLTGSAEEAGEIIAWVKEEAKATPFDVPGLIEASQQLMTWGLDLQEWFTVVGDTAAAMNRPITQVVNAVGTLASGQTGEAVRRFRDLGINLRDYAELEFDARGALVTPLEEAIPIVRQIMIERFGGMMESQSDTWAGVMSNMQDTWQQFVQVVGEPVFETLNETLRDLYSWVEENQDAIEGFAKDLGSFLGTALNALMDLMGAMGRFIGMVDQALERSTGSGIVQTFETGIENARAIAGFSWGLRRGAADFAGGLLGGEDVGEAFEGAKGAMVETYNNIRGIEDATQDATEAQIELTEAQLAGVEAVRAMGDEYENLTDQQIAQSAEAITDSQIEMARAFLDSEDAVSDLPPLLQRLVNDNRDLATSTLDAAEAYHESSDAFREQQAQIEAGIANYQRLKEEQQANIELASEVAGKLTEKLQDAIDDYTEAIEEATEETAEAIREIEAEAAQAEAEAISSNQAEIAQLRDSHAREQMRRRRQFNLEWARLIREQNQEVLDAEWEYQYQKENLLVEGDEIALAELEARYKHESEVRAREQGDARSDTQADFALEEQERQEQYEQQVRQLEARLQEEIAAIRQNAQEEVRAKEEALREKLAKEEEALNEKAQKVGEQLAQEVGDNQAAAQIVIGAWRAAYGDQMAQAVQTGLIVRQEMDAITQAAINAQTAVMGVGGGRASRAIDRGTPNDPNNPRYATGGYTPMSVTDITTHPGEFISDASTTAALERATGGPLTQPSVRSLASKQLDVNINAAGAPADMLARIERELIDALRDEAAF